MVSTTIAGAVAAASNSAKITLSSNYLVNLLLAGSLNHIWALIRSQQIIVLLPLYRICLPANAGIYFKVIMQIAAFDIVEMDEHY